MFYYIHNNNNNQYKMCWNKALTCGVGSINITQFSYNSVHAIHAKVLSLQVQLQTKRLHMILLLSSLVRKLCGIYIKNVIQLSDGCSWFHMLDTQGHFAPEEKDI